MDINKVIDSWNEQADGFNQWDDLGADEQVEFALKLCQSPQAGCEGIVGLNNLLSAEVKQCLKACSEKLYRYYNYTDKRYVGGVEHSALQERLKLIIAKL